MRKRIRMLSIKVMALCFRFQRRMFWQPLLQLWLI
uniref:Uncharacterized protein n=1 Tax=Rhizophora mucronata TaxID=61149 RepID=A0A2P2QDQ2_RHIMU